MDRFDEIVEEEDFERSCRLCLSGVVFLVLVDHEGRLQYQGQVLLRRGVDVLHDVVYSIDEDLVLLAA